MGRLSCRPAVKGAHDIGPEGADFITYPRGSGKSVTTNEQNVVMATLSGNTADWFSLPGDPGPIGLVLGAEYLEINANISTPDFIEKQLFEGFSTNPFSLDASTDITSVFGEALIPLVSGKPGVDFLELELGWRWSEHSITGSASTYKVAVSYYPTADFQFRASYNNVAAQWVYILYASCCVSHSVVSASCFDILLFRFFTICTFLLLCFCSFLLLILGLLLCFFTFSLKKLISRAPKT